MAANSSWLLAFDNFSHLPEWLSDALCRLATGGGFGTRQLYADDEERVFDAMRPVLLTGITDFLDRGDLLDRALLIYPPPISAAIPEKQLWQAFADARPRLLGALLDALVAELKREPELVLDGLPRMADYALWGAATAPALGVTPARFLTIYAGNRAEASQLPLEESPLTQPL